MATGPEHYRQAEELLADARDRSGAVMSYQDESLQIADAQVRATLAQAAATERLAMALENLPSYEGMLAVYNFGGAQ